VLGLEDERLGERVVAAVVLADMVHDSRHAISLLNVDIKLGRSAPHSNRAAIRRRRRLCRATEAET
jgi:hypothetical protein